MSFVIKQQSFEGALDLLLSLIEKRKFFINDISIAKVADDYIEYIQKLEKFPIGDSANFILIASTLLLIKSKSLLPNLTLSEEEQGSIEDLQLRLKIYEQIRNAGKSVEEIFGKKIIFSATSTKLQEINPIFSPSKNITIDNLITNINDILQNLPKNNILPKAIVKKMINLEEVIENLSTRIKSSLKMNFKDFSSIGKQEKVNIIVSFLAMLELVKRGVILVNQESHKNDIFMETIDVGIPRYE
ncbi:MAG: segregation/condensation protein A [Patescibacteria group bacterium]|nr:segregation/condensation protein A [Patescibacteria group bacterium]